MNSLEGNFLKNLIGFKTCITITRTGPAVVLLYTADLFSIVENKLDGYAEDSTLVAVVPSPGERVAVSESIYES